MFHRQHTQAPADSSPPSPRAPSRLACFQLLPPSSLVQSATLLLYGASGTLLTYITPSLLSYNLLPQFLAAFPSSAWESPLLPDQDLTTNLRFLLLSHSQAWPWEAGQRDDLLRDPQYQYTPFSFSDSPLPASKIPLVPPFLSLTSVPSSSASPSGPSRIKEGRLSSIPSFLQKSY